MESFQRTFPHGTVRVLWEFPVGQSGPSQGPALEVVVSARMQNKEAHIVDAYKRSRIRTEVVPVGLSYRQLIFFGFSHNAWQC